MQLPKNVTQIGETNPHCKIYVEDYVISYMKQLNQYAGDKRMAVALYGIRKEEDGITYLFFYGAGRLNFLQKECRHLSQAVLQESEKLRKRYFSDYVFLGYRLLDGEMVEGFHVCEQGVCRYIEGYAQFYEKNDSMLAYMVDQRQEEAKPEEFDQEKYNTVKKRQEERRALSEERGWNGGKSSALWNGHAKEPDTESGAARLRRMKYSVAAIFALLCVTGLAAMGNGVKLGDLQSAAGRFLDNLIRRQLPDDPEDFMEVSNGSVQVGTIVAEDKLNEAILKENEAKSTSEPALQPTPESSVPPAPNPGEQSTPEPVMTPEPVVTPQPTNEPQQTQKPAVQPSAEPVSYTVKRGDTLIGICIRRYGSDARVAEVCSLNNISNPDSIKIGQNILLP